MTEFTAIASETHAHKTWKNVTDYAFIAKDAVTPLVYAELSKAVLAMPTGFIKREDCYELVSINSLNPGQNLFVGPDGSWLGNYIPSAIQAYPFKLLKPEGAKDVVLCIDEASGLVTDSSEAGNDFFDDKNQLTQETKDIVNHLSYTEAGRAVTQEAVNALAKAGIVIPWALSLKEDLDDEFKEVKGFYRVDEAALNKLDDDVFLALRKVGALALAHSQLLSMNQIAILERLSMLQGLLLERQQTGKPAPDLAGFSLSEDTGSLVFD